MYDTIKTKLNAGIESKIYLIFAFIGITLLFYSILEIKPIVVGADSLGLASYLTIAYWIGFILMALLSVVLYLDTKVKHDGVYLIYLITIGLFLFGVAIFAEENARHVWSYYPTGEVKAILESSKIDKIAEYPLISYRSWPGTHIISAFMIYMVNTGVDGLIKYMPLFWMLSLIFITYSVGRLFRLSVNQCFMISFLILSSLWITDYYAPQSMAYILYLLFFVSITAFLYRQDTITNNMFAILIFVAATVTHMLTSMVLIISLLFSSRFIQPLYKSRFRLIALFVIIFISWYLFVASSMFSAGIRDLIRQITDVQLFSVFSTEKYSSGDILIRQIIHYSRIIYLGIYAILMVLATIFYLKGKTGDKNRELTKICFVWLASVLVWITLRYGAEIDDRVYIFSLLPMALIIITTFDRKIVAILAILLVTLHIPAHYGTESYDMIYTTELRGSEFIASSMNPSSTMNYYYGRLTAYYDPRLATSVRGVGSNKGIYDPDDKSLDASNYIVHSTQVSNYLIYFFGTDKIQTWLQKDNKLNLLYDNGNYTVYKNDINKR